jgi:hypothetical protein
MSKRLVAAIIVGTALAALSVPAAAGPVPAACVVVDADPVHAQVGYAPDGPRGCTTLP